MADPKRCQLCGERHPLWIGDAPQPGRCLVTGTAAICPASATKARAEAMRRKVCPDAFDADGKILPSGDALIRVIDAMEAAGLDMHTGLPIAAREAGE